MAAARKSHPTKTPGLYRVDPSRNYHDGGYEVRYRDGRNRTRRKTFKIKQDALDFKAAIRMDPTLADFRRRASTPFSEVAEDWYRTTATRDLKPKTREGYRNTLKRYLLPAFGDSAIGGIEASDLRDFLDELPKSLSPTTRRNIFRTLSPIFKLALVDGKVLKNPVPLVEQPKAATTNQYILTGEQVKTLAEAIAPEYRTLIYFLAYTGVRAGEAAALQVKNLDLLRRRVRIERSASEVARAYSDTDSRLVFGTPKNGKSREFTIPAFLGDMLAVHLTGRPSDPDALVFSAPRGVTMRWANFRKRHFHPTVKEVLPENFAPMRVHDLRHTCASLLIAAGVNAKAIQEQLGHSSISVTFDVYGSLFPDAHERVANAMEETYQRAASGSAEATVVPIR